MARSGAFGSEQNQDVFAEKNPELTCPICLEIFDGPVTTRCGHTFCRGCLRECLSRSEPPPAAALCAICRADLRGDEVEGEAELGRPAAELEALIRSSAEPCKGCRAEVRLGDMRSHTAACAAYRAYAEQEEEGARARRGRGGALGEEGARARSGRGGGGEEAAEPPAPPPPAPPPNRHTFACPYCDARHLDRDGLAEHCEARHARDARPVVCPVCAAMPWGDPEYRSGNFLRHLRTRHAFAYDTFVDYAAADDEELMVLEALQRSLLHR